ncbi:hypothetical protein [Bradyrhizobium sp. CCGE-LA001]|uniref:hypothetical protein n=1 Tax=Bradyrhizobium sp. CCGE-LA001 TaxID=1223566 RepID=UPI000745C843|nr:hypothetical protein [Bradyrhizobium sp. CCGE-LA001]AMA56829.1 hypothetical protein BCCGELA001_11620 [Bradyrhizobium sp. CCGE-LA001]
MFQGKGYDFVARAAQDVFGFRQKAAQFGPGQAHQFVSASALALFPPSLSSRADRGLLAEAIATKEAGASSAT